MAKFYSPDAVRKMSYNQIVKAVEAGDLTERNLRYAYSELRSIARKRNERLQSANVTREFGRQEPEYFRQTRNIPLLSQLMKETADVNRFLRRKNTTIKGLREQKETAIRKMREHGLPVTSENYADWNLFMKWFKSTEYAATYDSDDDIVEEVFEEGSNIADWEKLFQQFVASGRYNRATIKEYNE